MENLKEIFEKISNQHIEYAPAYDSKNWGVISKEFIDKICLDFNCTYPEVFIQFQLIFCQVTPLGDFAWDGFGWANPDLEPYMNLYEIVKDARSVGVPEYLSPFRSDNGDYYCFDSRNQAYSVVVWDHNSNSIEVDSNYKWLTFIDWIESSF